MISISKLHRKSVHRVLLDSVDLSILPGQKIGLIGNSGSGKSLLLRSIALLEPRNSGTIVWHDNEVTPQNATSYRSDVIYLHQRPARCEGTVENALRLPYQLSIHRRKNFDRSWMLERLETVGKEAAFLDQNHDQLSGGESQIVAILRAIQLNPSVLLLDEPTSALDATTVKQVERLVQEWLHHDPTNRSFVWVSHETAQTERLCNRILSMDAGRLRIQKELA